MTGPSTWKHKKSHFVPFIQVSNHTRTPLSTAVGCWDEIRPRADVDNTDTSVLARLSEAALY